MFACTLNAGDADILKKTPTPDDRGLAGGTHWSISVIIINEAFGKDYQDGNANGIQVGVGAHEHVNIHTAAVVDKMGGGGFYFTILPIPCAL